MDFFNPSAICIISVRGWRDGIAVSAMLGMPGEEAVMCTIFAIFNVQSTSLRVLLSLPLSTLVATSPRLLFWGHLHLETKQNCNCW
jgi:hypothetical protein